MPLFLFVIMALVSMAAVSSADIYMYIDSKGVLHFTNAPTSSNYKLYVKERPVRARRSVDTDRFDTLIDQAARLNNLAFPLLKALIRAESAFNPKAVSRKGAMGLMQIMPENIKAFRVDDPFDPWDNIMGGARYLKKLLKRFNGQVPLALAAYNAGPTIVDAYQGIPQYPETQEYVRKVMKFYHLYKKG